jgi:hypothetical protein
MDDMTIPMRDFVAGFVENSNADAVVVAFSTVKRNRTRTYMATFGNMLACRGLVDELYSQVVEEGGEEEDGDDEDE